MRILYHHRTRADDGQGVHIRALQKALEGLGHEVFEVSLVQRGASRPAKAPARRWSAVDALPRFARELAEYSYSSLGRPRIVSAAVKHDAQVIYERYAFGNAAGIMAARKLRLPLILEVNSPMVLELSRTRGLSFPRLARSMETWIFRSADRVCVVTDVLREMLVELGVERSRIFVTPNGVHLEQFDFGPGARESARAALGLAVAQDDVLLGFVGFYRDWHRLDLVLDALARPGLERARLVLVGEGPAHGELVERASRLGVSARVHFAGPRPHEAVAGLLPAFDAALVPAINPYASPLKLFEYMAAGLPSVAPDQPNLREVLEHERNALLVRPGDAASLEAALARLVGDRVLRERLGARARSDVIERDLTWTGNARRVVAVAEELLAERARRVALRGKTSKP